MLKLVYFLLSVSFTTLSCAQGFNSIEMFVRVLTDLVTAVGQTCTQSHRLINCEMKMAFHGQAS